MKKTMLFALSLFFVGVVTANENPEIEVTNYENIKKVFMNTSTSYTFVIEKSKGVYFPKTVSCIRSGGRKPEPLIEYREDSTLNHARAVIKILKDDGSFSSSDSCLELVIYLPQIENIKGGSAKHNGLKSPRTQTKEFL